MQPPSQEPLGSGWSHYFFGKMWTHRSSTRPKGPRQRRGVGRFACGHALALTHDQGESGLLFACGGSQVGSQAWSCSSMAGVRGTPVASPPSTQRTVSAEANFKSWEAGPVTLSPEQAASLSTQEPGQVTRLRKRAEC